MILNELFVSKSPELMDDTSQLGGHLKTHILQKKNIIRWLSIQHMSLPLIPKWIQAEEIFEGYEVRMWCVIASGWSQSIFM